MGNFSLGQLIILILLILLAFGDFSKLTKSLKHFLNKHQFINTEKKKTGKKGVEPLTFGFGNHCSTN